MTFARLAPFSLRLCAVAALLAGCGGGGSSSTDDNGVADKTAEQIVGRTRPGGEGRELGLRPRHDHERAAQPLEIDLHLVEGKGGAGHLETNGQSFDIVALGGKAYIKGDDAFWKQIGGDAAVQLFHGKWLTASSDRRGLRVVRAADRPRPVLRGRARLPRDAEKGDETDVDGAPAIVVVDSSQGERSTSRRRASRTR